MIFNLKYKKVENELKACKETISNLQQELSELKAQKENEVKKPPIIGSRESLEEIGDTRKKSGSVERLDHSRTEEYKVAISKLRHELKEKTKKLNEIQQGQNREIEKNKITIAELTSGLSRFRKEVEQKDKKIQDLEKYAKETENNLELANAELERVNKQPKHEIADYSSSKVTKNSSDSDESLEKIIQNLKVENQNLRNELEQFKRIMSSNQSDEVNKTHSNTSSILQR